MNLIQIQDDLKSLPNGQQTLQILASYANGANPQVPPYLALGELNRRKQLMDKFQQEQQAAQAPQGTVKDQIEQQAGVMGLQQQRMMQAQQQMVGQMATQPTQVPPGIEQPAPIQAAGGGLLSRLMSYPAARYRSGGVVAFAGGTDQDDVRRMMDVGMGAPDSDEDSELSEEERRRRQLMKEAARFRSTRPSMADFDRIAMRQAAIKADPRLAAADADVGAGALSRLDEYQRAQQEEFARQRAENAKAKPGILQLLSQAAIQTGGGLSRGDALARTLAGYGALSQKQGASALEQERDIRAKELAMQQVRMAAQDKLNEANRARAEGRIDDYVKGIQEYRRIVKDYDVAGAGLLRGEIAATESAAARKQVAATAAEARKAAAEAAANRPQRITDQENAVATFTQEFMDRGIPEAQARVMATEKYLKLRAQAPLAAVEQRTREAADKAVSRAEMFNDATWKKYVTDNKGDKAAAKAAYIQDYMAGAVPEPTQGAPGSTAAKPAPKAPAAPSALKTKPDISSVQGAPSGSSVGNYVTGKGWEIKDSKGKLIGYAPQ